MNKVTLLLFFVVALVAMGCVCPSVAVDERLAEQNLTNIDQMQQDAKTMADMLDMAAAGTDDSWKENWDAPGDDPAAVRGSIELNAQGAVDGAKELLANAKEKNKKPD